MAAPLDGKEAYTVCTQPARLRRLLEMQGKRYMAQLEKPRCKRAKAQAEIMNRRALSVLDWKRERHFVILK